MTWILDALKRRSISELILPEKTWKGMKTVLFKFQVTTNISELLNTGAEMTAPNSNLRYENLSELPPE